MILTPLPVIEVMLTSSQTFLLLEVANILVEQTTEGDSITTENEEEIRKLCSEATKNFLSLVIIVEKLN